MGFDLGKLLDGALIAKFGQADSLLGSELNGLLGQLPQSSQNQIATTLQKLFQADDVSTALPGLNNLAAQIPRQGISAAQAAALGRIIDLMSRIARARLLLDQLYDELDRLLQTKGSGANGNNGNAVADQLRSQTEFQQSLTEMQALSASLKQQSDILKSITQNFR